MRRIKAVFTLHGKRRFMEMPTPCNDNEIRAWARGQLKEFPDYSMITVYEITKTGNHPLVCKVKREVQQ